ncbi:MAG: response regulator transcription factor [Candidatus Eremiobacteraeota bacterium]|nr:response regulator transcription factor [Candidatus Eremiobacteraeota bacterium]
MASNTDRSFRAFPRLPVEALSNSSRNLQRRLQQAINGLYGPLPQGWESVLNKAVNTLADLQTCLQAAAQAGIDNNRADAPTSNNVNIVHLTIREREILRMVCEGHKNNDIALQLNFGVGTIKAHVRDILEKLGATDRTEAAVIAVKKGLI